VLSESVELLERINDDGLLTAIAEGTFGVTRRPPDGGKGLDGVVERADGYVNPAIEILDTEDPHAHHSTADAQEVPA
jgi:beta-lysine 5,6-aminomutase alpha subunit